MDSLAVQAVAQLKELMDNEGVTAKELSRRAGVGNSTVLRIIRGEQVPTLDMYERLAAGLGVTVHIRIE